MNRKALLTWVKKHIVICAGSLICIVAGAMVVLHLFGMINDIPTAVDVLIAILGGAVTLYGAIMRDIRNRKYNFKESAIYMNKHYPIVARYATEIEDRRFKGERDGYASSYTVCDKSWVPDKPIEFSKIKVRLERELYDTYDTVTDGGSVNPIDITPETELELERGNTMNRSPKDVQELLNRLYDRGNAILPYRFKTFAQNVQLINGRNVIPYPSFALTQIKTGKDEVEMTIRMGSYDDFYNTCVFSSYELTHDIFVNGDQKTLLDISDDKVSGERNERGERIFRDDKKLLYRKAIDTMKFDNRFASIGINTLTILKNLPDIDYNNKDAVRDLLDKDKRVKEGYAKGDFLLMHIRGNDVAEGPGLYHVVPAGSYQPTEIKKVEDGVCKTQYINLDPTSTVIKEFAEEVLKEGGSNDLISREWIQDIYSKMEHELYFLGVALEPVNLKTEVLSVLIIDVEKTNCADVNIIESILQFNENVEGKIKLLPLKRKYIDQYKDNVKTAPAGRAILSLFTDKKYVFDDGEMTLLERWSDKDRAVRKVKDHPFFPEDRKND